MSKLSRMQEGGKLHGRVRRELYSYVKVGVSPWQVESLAQRLIKEAGAETSFTKVPGYHWATCVNIGAGTVHGIPTSRTPFIAGDVVTVDLGLYYRGYHLDGAFTKVVGQASPASLRLIKGGLHALSNALAVIKPGNRVGDISRAIESTLQRYDLSPFRELTGHGVGRELHENPMIPNLLSGKVASTPQLVIGQTLAIELIFTLGRPQLVLEEDGWTLTTKDGKLSGVLEETVKVTPDGCSVLTEPPLSQIMKSGRIGNLN